MSIFNIAVIFAVATAVLFTPSSAADSILASTELRENLQQVKGHHPTEPPQSMEGVATAGGGGSSGGSPNKAQESEGRGGVMVQRLEGFN